MSLSVHFRKRWIYKYSALEKRSCVFTSDNGVLPDNTSLKNSLVYTSDLNMSLYSNNPGRFKRKKYITAGRLSLSICSGIATTQLWRDLHIEKQPLLFIGPIFYQSSVAPFDYTAPKKIWLERERQYLLLKLKRVRMLNIQRLNRTKFRCVNPELFNQRREEAKKRRKQRRQMLTQDEVEEQRRKWREQKQKIRVKKSIQPFPDMLDPFMKDFRITKNHLGQIVNRKS